MSRLIPLKAREIISKLQKLWYHWPVSWWRHQHMIKWTKVIPIPIHGSHDIGVGLIKKIINEIEITNDQWIEL